jgi:hypothetical protein
MNKPVIKRNYNHQTSLYEALPPKYARIMRGSWYSNEPIEVVLIRPTKIDISPLRLLAETTVGKGEEVNAPSILKNHLVDAFIDQQSSTDKSQVAIRNACKDLSIRQDDKAKDRKQYTLKNLERKFSNHEGRVRNSEYLLENARHTIEVQTKRLAELAVEGPRLEKKIAKLKKELAEAAEKVE